jgi:hypothetical protein
MSGVATTVAVQQSMEHYHEKTFRILRNDKSCPG